MTTFTVDWQQHEKSTITELNENHFKFNPLIIYTKEGSNFKIDARIIMEIDDDSTVVKLFGSVPVFVDNMLSTLIRNFFTYKETAEITSYRLKIQEEFLKLAQEKLTKYGVKVTTFMIIYVSMLPSSINKDEEQKVTMKETNSIKNVSDKKYDTIYKLLGSTFFSLVLLSIAILLDTPRINFDNRIPITWGTIISIVVVIIGVYQYFEIRKIRQMLKKEKVCA